MLLPIPPVGEQREVVSRIEGQQALIGDLVAGAESTIGLLKERRAAIIAAAVTGQIEVEGRAQPRRSVA